MTPVLWLAFPLAAVLTVLLIALLIYESRQNESQRKSDNSKKNLRK